MNLFVLLAGEAVRDAARRRIVAVLAVVSLLSLLVVDSCTSCSSAEFVVNGELREFAGLTGYAGALTFVLLGLWCVVLAGVLAADHLAETLADGSATLCLARPVSRRTFAVARLAGALAVAWGTGALLLGGTGWLVIRRSAELPVSPALLAAAAVAAGGLAVGGLSMAASLVLPRLATILLVVAGTAIVALANAIGLVREEATGGLALVDRLGPPLLTSLVHALAPWSPALELAGEPWTLAGRLGLWAAVGVGALWFAFERVELGR